MSRKKYDPEDPSDGTIPQAALEAAEEAAPEAEPTEEGEPEPKPEPAPERRRGRPRLTDEERARRKMERDAEERGMPTPRDWARGMMKMGYQGSSEVFFQPTDEYIGTLKALYAEKYPQVATLPDTLALTEPEAESLAIPTELCVDYYFPGLLDRVGPGLMLLGTLAQIAHARYRMMQQIKAVAQSIQRAGQPAVVHHMPGAQPTSGPQDAPPP